MRYGYGRVSSDTQNLDRQEKAFKDYGLELKNCYFDKASGKNFERENWKLLNDIVLREKDELVVQSLDRLGRNKEEVKTLLQDLKKRKIKIRVLDIPTTLVDLPSDWSDMINNILIEVYTSIAENERRNILKRQGEGIEIAKKKGKYKGRKQEYHITKDFEKMIGLVKEKRLKHREAMTILGLKEATYFRLLKKFREKN